MTFTTFDDNNNNSNTINDAVATLTDKPSMTSDLTTSTNPQQHGRTVVNHGGGHGQGCNGQGSSGHGHHGRHTITCFCCGENGYYASPCPNSLEDAQRCLALAEFTTTSNETETANQLLMAGTMYDEQEDEDTTCQFFLLTDGTLQTCHGGHIPKEWILLDSQSTVSVFNNHCLLKNIHKSDGWMHIHCNVGITRTNLMGDFSGYRMVWYHPDGIANILSLAEVHKQFHAPYDSSKRNEFIVHKPDGSTKQFIQCERGLYYLDTSTKGVMLINTVDDNKSKYSNADCSHAQLPRRIQPMIGRPNRKTSKSKG